MSKFGLELMGAFRLSAPDGERLNITSKRARALVAMLATARHGERSRVWLQDRLWGSRNSAQSQASLRRELYNLRPLVNISQIDVLRTNHENISLDLGQIDLDCQKQELLRSNFDEFLEGLDLPGEEGFEDWLREERRKVAHLRTDNIKKSVATDHENRTSVDVASPLSGRPSLSVLIPVQEVREEEVVLEGVRDILVERLARLRWLTLISSPSGMTSLATGDHLSKVGGILGADYLLRCHLTNHPPDRKIWLELNESASEKHLWGKSFSIDHAFDGAAFGNIAEEVAAALTARIETEQHLHVLDRGIQRLNVNELVWRARWHIRRLTKKDAELATELLARAEQKNPNDPDILLEKCFLKAWQVWALRGSREEKLVLRSMATLARNIDPFDARAYLLCGVAEMWLGQHNIAANLFQQAIGFNPSMAGAYGQLGSCYSLAGEPEKALPLLATAQRLDPVGNESFHQLGERALAYFMLGRHDEAVSEADRALALRPAYFYAHAIKLAALSEMGSTADLDIARQAITEAKPNLHAEALAWLPFKDPTWIQKLQEAINPVDGRSAATPTK